MFDERSIAKHFTIANFLSANPIPSNLSQYLSSYLSVLDFVLEQELLARKLNINCCAEYYSNNIPQYVKNYLAFLGIHAIPYKNNSSVCCLSWNKRIFDPYLDWQLMVN